MFAALKSEFRKLLTIRSTYIISGLALVFIIFLSFFIEGYKGVSGSPAAMGVPTAFNEMFINIAGLVAVFGGIVVILLAAHEYRHNTIVYTLAAANNRGKVLLAKLIVAAVYLLAFLAIALGIGLGAYMLGITASPRLVELQPQVVQLAVLGRVVFYVLAYGLLALLVTVLVRHLVGAVVIVFMVPSTVEPLLGLLLKDNAAYLPFSALQQVLTPAQRVAGGGLSATEAIVTSLIYLGVGWAVAWALFMRRDAN